MYPRKLYGAVWMWVFWVVHLKLLILNTCVVGYYLLDYDGRMGRGVPGGYAFAFALVVLNLICEPAEMTMWCHHMLEPWVHLVLEILKSVFWSVMVGLGIRVTVNTDGVQPEWLKYLIYAMLVVTALSFYASLIYAIFIFQLNRKTGGYTITAEQEPSIYVNAHMSGGIRGPRRTPSTREG